MFKKTLFLTAALLGIAPAHAGSPGTPGIDIFGGTAAFKIREGSDRGKPEGHDVGTRLIIPIVDGLFIRGEYTHLHVDESIFGGKLAIITQEFRGGAGYFIDLSPQLKIFATADYVSLDLKVKADASVVSKPNPDGFALGLGASADLGRATLYAKGGYLSVKEGETGKGAEFIAGLQFNAFKYFGIFSEYSHKQLKFKSSDSQYDLSSIRAGIRFNFPSGSTPSADERRYDQPATAYVPNNTPVASRFRVGDQIPAPVGAVLLSNPHSRAAVVKSLAPTSPSLTLKGTVTNATGVWWLVSSDADTGWLQETQLK